jgi:endonuclease/exonuclease/phosphatase family metal-dependent hydrolase
MKNSLKIIGIVFAIITLVIVSFYVWASSSNHTEDEYVQLIRNDYPIKSSRDTTFSIISYNIGYLSGMTNNRPVPKTKELFDNNLENVYQAFSEIKADIIGFQEIDYHAKRSFYINQQEELHKLGYNYIYQAVNWDVNYLPFPGNSISNHHGKIYSGQSIFSNFPIKDVERIILKRVASHKFYRDAFYLDRVAQVCKIRINEKDVVLINVHLEAFDVPTRINHANHIVKLYNKYKDDYPVLLIGDFNSDLSFENPAIKIILDIPGIGCASFDGTNTLKTYPSRQPTNRLDYIFYNKKFIEPIASKILTSFGEASDHLPIWMKFKLN